MASGRAVIATDVGGMTNVVLNGFNGLLVPPRPQPLRDALQALIEHAEMRTALGRNARASAQAFALPRWRTAWRGAIRQVYGEPLA